MKLRKLMILWAVALAAPAAGQQIAVKTNLLYGAGTLTPNLGAEIGLGKKSTLDVAVGYNPWNLDGSYTDNKKWVHLLVQPEFRYWTCERFNGHFFGVHGVLSHYNIGGLKIPLLGMEKAVRYEGYAYGGGLSYGYHRMLSKHWGVEFTVGVGAVYFDHERYTCEKCGSPLGTATKTYVGPTKAGISLVYLIK
jgi:hypothetical protein